MAEPDDEEDEIRRPAPPPGWRVLTRPERKSDPIGDELRELFRDINGRRRGPAAPEQTDGPPEAA
jgi:hypothetical protein